MAFKIRKDKSMSSDVMIDNYLSRKNRLSLALRGDVSLSEALESDKPEFNFYNKDLFICDVAYFTWLEPIHDTTTLSNVLGCSVDSAKDLVINKVKAVEDSTDKVVALTEIRKLFGSKNPLLYLLKMYNSLRKSIFESSISDLFTTEDYNFPKNNALLKRNLVLTKPQLRERVQIKFSINTNDLKKDGKKTLFLCQSCLVENWFEDNVVSEDPVQACACGQIVTPSRHMIGYKTSVGRIFKCTTLEVQCHQDGKITKTPTKKFFDKLFDETPHDKQEYLTSLMLWHHDSKVRHCQCSECLS